MRRTLLLLVRRPVVLLALLLVLLALGGTGVLWLAAERAQANARAEALLRTEQRAAQLADALGSEVQALLGGVDIALQHLLTAWRAERGEFDARAQAIIRAMPEGAISHVTVTDAAGDALYNSLGRTEGLNISDRAHFRAQKERPGDHLYVGNAVRSRLVKNQWVVVVNRPIYSAGRFAGTMNVNVPTAFFARHLASLTLDAGDIVALLHTDGSFVARSRDNERAMSIKVPAERPYLHGQGPDRGVYRAVGEVDKVARVYAWHRLSGQSLVVTVGLAEASALAPLAAGQAREQKAMALLLVLVLAAAAGVVALLWQAARQQRALERSERRYRTLVDTSPDAIFLVQGLSFAYLNPSALRLFGAQDAAQLIGQPVMTRVHPDYHAQARLRREAVQRTGLPQKAQEERYVRMDGSIIDVEVSIGPYGDHGADMRQIVVREITERRRAAQALQQQAEELERRVEQRTAALRAARDEAERANQAKSEFLSRMSHELRTPLNAVLGFGQLLELELQDAAPRAQVRHILQAGQHLLELINDVLDLARIESGHLTVSVEPVALQPLILDCLNLVRTQATARGLSVTAPANGSGRRVLADRTRLKQVLLNLLSNAVKYNREQGRITLLVQDEGTHWRLCVDDTGAGLDAAQRARLFVPFERLEADRSAVEGTGIGLALCRRMVELMHGEIGVESEPGVGSRFWVRLPKAAEPGAQGQAAAAGLPTAADPAQAAALTPAPDAEGALPDTGTTLPLLCIEDNPVNLEVLQHMVALRPRWKLLGATTPTRGLELARQRQPRLILLDINLPEMDGWSVMQALRADPATSAIPVVAVSAHTLPADLARGRAVGFVDYLTKPVALPLLLAILDRYAE